MFGDAEAYGMPGQVAGRPGGVYFECDKNYSNFGNGGYSSQYEYVYVGTTTPVYGAFDNGYITAGSYATLGPRYLTEVEGQPSNSPAAFGQMNVSAYDADTSTYATVTGINYANEFQLTANSPEINLISSVVPNPGFTIHMSGNLYQYIPGRGTVVLGQNVPITCTAGAHVGAISNPSGYMRYGYPDDQYAENAYELFNNRD